MDTVRFNCAKNDNYLKFIMHKKRPGKVYIGTEGSECSAIEMDYNDLLDSLLLVVGGHDLMVHLGGRLDIIERERWEVKRCASCGP